jgi:hypothetical protein
MLAPNWQLFFEIDAKLAPFENPNWQRRQVANTSAARPLSLQ